MLYDEKRTHAQPLDQVQGGNRQWWTDHTMSYDWGERLDAEKFSRGWFEEIDRRFVYSARLFGHDAAPFDRIIPYAELKGRRVLEIGCGMGLHSELIASAGAAMTAIDISDTSVMATRNRSELKGLNLDVRQMDACALQFDDNSFDFVWSWGVIHHSASTGQIVKEIYRVLKPGGEVRAMVYNLDGMPAYITIVSKYLLNFWRGKSLDHYLWQSTDGYLARHYTKDTLADLFNIFFHDTTVVSLGQDADAIPLPGRLRRYVVPLVSEKTLARWANSRGAFLFLTATK
jgi:2-polyprenyl-3-methyl-5-hydroxy-6-metoxy-1,4-benzoquinol methylase